MLVPPPIVNKCGGGDSSRERETERETERERAVELCSEMGTATTAMAVAAAANFPPRSHAPRLIVPLHCRFEPCCVRSAGFGKSSIPRLRELAPVARRRDHVA